MSLCIINKKTLKSDGIELQHPLTSYMYFILYRVVIYVHASTVWAREYKPVRSLDLNQRNYNNCSYYKNSSKRMNLVVSIVVILSVICGALADHEINTTVQFLKAQKICSSLGRQFSTTRSKKVLLERYPNLIQFCLQMTSQRNQSNETEQQRAPITTMRKTKCKLYNWKGFSLCSRGI